MKLKALCLILTLKLRYQVQQESHKYNLGHICNQLQFYYLSIITCHHINTSLQLLGHKANFVSISCFSSETKEEWHLISMICKDLEFFIMYSANSISVSSPLKSIREHFLSCEETHSGTESVYSQYRLQMSSKMMTRL